jgi:carboxymethylenebutenolidase
MSQIEFKLPTADGQARAFSFQPEGDGPWHAVVFIMDAPAIRPALFQMCERIAEQGYFVLLPDLFWRAGPYAPLKPREVLVDPVARKALLEPLRNSTDPQRSTADLGAALEWLALQPQVAPGPVALAGYCMGGALALRAAAAYPERVAAVGAFHAGGVATDAADSPHLLAPRIKARVYVGGADQDASFPPEQAERLRTALTEAGVDNVVEIYEGARHGYAPADTPAHDSAAAERHFRALFDLLDQTLSA